MLIKKLQGSDEKKEGFYYEFDLHSQPLGNGGMGVVYKGEKIYETTQNRCPVAIKVMYEGLPDDVYERARREASIRLRNDNLVEMLGFISEVELDPFGVQKTRYYVVSEYLHGVVLSDVLAGQVKDRDGSDILYAKQLYADYLSDPEKTSLRIIRSILSGILALHDKGYIHRDIDPSNIMVTDQGNIKLIDFGIAKYVRCLETKDNSLTSTGKFIGKAEYASPELVLGDVKNQGYPTDIYAIGIVLYQLLVRKLPFSGSKFEVLQKQLNEKMPVKHIKNPRLRKIVKIATEKNRGDRYPNVATMRAEIDKAEMHPLGFCDLYWKQCVAVLAGCVVCVGAFYLKPVLLDVINNPSDHSDTTKVESEPTQSEPNRLEVEFKAALAKLDSKDPQIAQEGLDQMEALADKNSHDAIKELGVTYCTFDKVQSESVKSRRKTLNLSKETSKDLSLEYLKQIASTSDVSVDALYVLGYSYWRDQEWAKGEEVLTKAQALLSKISANSVNGFSRKDLESGIQRYLKLCKEQLK